MVAVVVETRNLLETVLASLVAGVGVTLIFSIGIWATARFADLNRNNRSLAAGAAGALAALAFAATLAAVVLGIVIMTRK